MIKLPTAKDDDEGVGTGKTDFALDAIVSKEVNARVEWSGYLGVMLRGDPDAVDLSNGLRWGVGVGVPSRKSLRFTAELSGERYFSDSVTMTTPVVAVDGRRAPPETDLNSPGPGGGVSGPSSPLETDLNSPVQASFGLTWQGKNGVFAGAGIAWNLHMDNRDNFFSSFEDRTGDNAGWQFRLGYHPGGRGYGPPPPRAAPPA